MTSLPKLKSKEMDGRYVQTSGASEYRTVRYVQTGGEKAGRSSTNCCSNRSKKRSEERERSLKMKKGQQSTTLALRVVIRKYGDAD